jgi:hypothetical protein
VGQASAFADKSRSALYTKKSYKTATEHAEHSVSTRTYDVQSKNYRVRPLPSSQWTPVVVEAPVLEDGQKPSSRQAPAPAPSPSPAPAAAPTSSSNASSSASTKSTAKRQPPPAQSPKGSFDSQGNGAWPDEPTRPPKPTGRTQGKSKHEKAPESSSPLHGGSGSSSNQYRDYDDHPSQQPAGAAFRNMANNDDGGDAVAAAVDVAKDVTKALGKSLLSFASFSLKAVGEVAAAATEKYQAHTGQSIQVGNMTVSITRELAEGGFGTVYLVQVGCMGGISLKGLPPFITIVLFRATEAEVTR